MPNRLYYSARTGRHPEAVKLELPLLKRLFLSVYNDFDGRCYFQEALGYYCVDEGYQPGTIGKDVDAFFFRQLRKQNLWPIAEKVDLYTEDDLLDVVELLHDLVSKPVQGFYHEWGGCGWHYSTFDGSEGKADFRDEMNALLKDYDPAFQLSPDGEILIRGDGHLQDLIDADLPELDPSNVEGRVKAAVTKFRRRQASADDRRDALRDLADVLEYLRPHLSTVLSSKDESELFNIANNFGIRHHNQKQRTRYEQDVWFESLFYYYLNMIRTVARLLAKKGIQI